MGLSHITHVYYLLQDLSVRTKMFDPVTLTPNFDLLLKKKLILCINILTERDLKILQKLERGVLVLIGQPRSSFHLKLCSKY